MTRARQDRNLLGNSVQPKNSSPLIPAVKTHAMIIPFRQWIRCQAWQ